LKTLINIKSHKAGFTLVELLIGIVIIGMILGGISQLLGYVLAKYQADQASQISQGNVTQAQQALERMVMFVQESDTITEPASTTAVERLTVSERVSDQYNNVSHAYVAAGDNIPDADNNANGLINEGGADPADFITFELDKTDAANWKLTEQMPDYSTADTGDFKTKVILCEHVQAFTCRKLATGRVEIVLTAQKGSTSVNLKTTAKSRWVE
jgi:prepilin-type N-terminal cleavage/methylation domain-containing protein